MPPVWLSKDETDACYDESVRTLISLVREDVEACKKGAAGPTIGALFGTHNWNSANLVVDQLVKQELASEESDKTVRVSDAAMQRVAVAQLYGECLSAKVGTMRSLICLAFQACQMNSPIIWFAGLIRRHRSC